MPDPDKSIDPFREARESKGVLRCPFSGEMITMMLRHEDVKKAAADWEKFSSNAPFRVPIPSEEEMRSVRQLPIEVDPPVHGELRKITEPFFLRAKRPDVISAVTEMIEGMVDHQLKQDSFDAVSDFALPIQSRALTWLLNMPESESETWIRWGIHVFHPQEGETRRGSVLEDYLNSQFDRAERDPGDDFFSALVTADFQGRKLTRDECLGFANLAFAGGRDTIIHSLTSIIAYLGANPTALEFLREDTKRITLATEEFLRVFMPLTQIGRVCPKGAKVHGESVEPGQRIGLCWSSANFDEAVFEDAHEVKLDRRPNPHVSFGFRNHLCQGAAHARLVIKSMLQSLCNRNIAIQVQSSVPNIEVAQEFERLVGYKELQVRFSLND